MKITSDFIQSKEGRVEGGGEREEKNKNWHIGFSVKFECVYIYMYVHVFRDDEEIEEKSHNLCK